METASKRRERTCFMKMEIKEKISLGFISSYARTWWPLWIAILGARRVGFLTLCSHPGAQDSDKIERLPQVMCIRAQLTVVFYL